MLKKRYIIIALGIVSVLLGSLLYNNVILAQSGGEYDPWLDYNEDGLIDVNDLSPLGQSYGSSGDPTKNVNVANWPVSTAVIVWWQQDLLPSDSLYSDFYNASGFGYLHVLLDGALSGTDFLIINIWGTLSTEIAFRNVRAYSVTLNGTFPSNQASITIPVPSEVFQFNVYAFPTNSFISTIYCSFYLTWA